MKKIVLLLSAFLLGTTLSLKATPPDQSWLTDFQKAEAAAKEKKQPLFLVFSQNDGNAVGKKFDKEILQSAKFKAYAKDKFILAYLDCPTKPGQPENNTALAKQYGVKGYPTVVVVKDGKVAGKLTYMKIDEFLKELKKTIKETAEPTAKKK